MASESVHAVSSQEASAVHVSLYVNGCICHIPPVRTSADCKASCSGNRARLTTYVRAVQQTHLEVQHAVSARLQTARRPVLATEPD